MTNPSDAGPSFPFQPACPANPPHGGGAILMVAPPLELEALEAAQLDSSVNLQAVMEAARPRMFAVALRMTRNPDDADDVVQEAMLKVWRAFGRFEGRAALSTWIHRIVVNAALNRLRARGPVVALATRTEDEAFEREGAPDGAAVETPEELVRSAEVGAEVHRALGALPPAQRQVLALRELEGESYQSIADIVRCPIGTVMSRLHHARHRLAEEITTNHRELVSQAA